jgi:hypothetical protein
MSCVATTRVSALVYRERQGPTHGLGDGYGCDRVVAADALRTLGNFYAKNGQRVPLSDEVITVVLKDLAAAEESLELF